MRAGRFVQQPTDYIAFEPAPLPPEPPIKLDGELIRLLSAADLALGRLDGITGILPNPDLFVAMYVRQEAVLSSQIEGTQASLTDVLQFEAGEREDGKLRDVEEVVNYVGAMNYGLEQTTLPMSLRLIREIHGRLMQGVRGDHLEPREFRRSQNWIGAAGCTLSTASFVPRRLTSCFSVWAISSGFFTTRRCRRWFTPGSRMRSSRRSTRFSMVTGASGGC